jgi:hypothetical protein
MPPLLLDLSQFFRSLPDIYQRNIIDADKQPQFLIFVSFTLTFLVVRVITISIREGRSLPFVRNIEAGGTHIHHLVPGIVLLLVVGYLAVAIRDGYAYAFAIAYGIGAALTLDEFALWLHLEDVYWLEKGHISIRAVLFFAGFVGIVGVGAIFFLEIGRSFAQNVIEHPTL